jgi:hypothetical protein
MVGTLRIPIGAPESTTPSFRIHPIDRLAQQQSSMHRGVHWNGVADCLAGAGKGPVINRAGRRSPSPAHSTGPSPKPRTGGRGVIGRKMTRSRSQTAPKNPPIPLTRPDTASSASTTMDPIRPAGWKSIHADHGRRGVMGVS